MPHLQEQAHSPPGAVPRAAKRLFASLASPRQGAAAVEFALLVPVLLVIGMALIDLGMAVFNKMELMSAVRTGAQVALMDSSNTTEIVSAVTNSTDLSPTIITTPFCECSDGTPIGCGGSCTSPLIKRTFMTISATQSFTPITPRLIPGFMESFSLSGQVTVRTE